MLGCRRWGGGGGGAHRCEGLKGGNLFRRDSRAKPSDCFKCFPAGNRFGHWFFRRWMLRGQSNRVRTGVAEALRESHARINLRERRSPPDWQLYRGSWMRVGNTWLRKLPFFLVLVGNTHTNTITCVCTHLHARLPGAVCLLALRSNSSRAGRGTGVADFGRKTIKRESSSLVVLQMYLMYAFGPKGVKGEEPIAKDKTNSLRSRP